MPEVIILCLAFVCITALVILNYVERVEFSVWLENMREAVRNDHDAHGAHSKDGFLICCNTFNGTPNHAAHAAMTRS